MGGVCRGRHRSRSVVDVGLMVSLGSKRRGERNPLHAILAHGQQHAYAMLDDGISGCHAGREVAWLLVGVSSQAPGRVHPLEAQDGADGDGKLPLRDEAPGENEGLGDGRLGAEPAQPCQPPAAASEKSRRLPDDKRRSVLAGDGEDGVDDAKPLAEPLLEPGLDLGDGRFAPFFDQHPHAAVALVALQAAAGPVHEGAGVLLFLQSVCA